jgi:hypothetical protein
MLISNLLTGVYSGALLAKQKIALIGGGGGVGGVDAVEGRLFMESSIFGYGTNFGQRITRPCASGKNC